MARPNALFCSRTIGIIGRKRKRITGKEEKIIGEDFKNTRIEY